MNTYRVSKYNPLYRTNDGFYNKDEWTSICDIGKLYEEVEFTEECYSEYENAYISVIEELVSILGVNSFYITDLQKMDLIQKLKHPHLYSDEIMSIYHEIDENKSVSAKEMFLLSRLMLREDICGCINEVSNCLKIEFGYDYYMYIYFDKDNYDILKSICDRNHLFIDKEFIEMIFSDWD